MIDVKQAVQIVKQKAAEIPDQVPYNFEEIEKVMYKRARCLEHHREFPHGAIRTPLKINGPYVRSCDTSGF